MLALPCQSEDDKGQSEDALSKHNIYRDGPKMVLPLQSEDDKDWSEDNIRSMILRWHKEAYHQITRKAGFEVGNIAASAQKTFYGPVRNGYDDWSSVNKESLVLGNMGVTQLSLLVPHQYINLTIEHGIHHLKFEMRSSEDRPNILSGVSRLHTQSGIGFQGTAQGLPGTWSDWRIPLGTQIIPAIPLVAFIMLFSRSLPRRGALKKDRLGDVNDPLVTMQMKDIKLDIHKAQDIGMSMHERLPYMCQVINIFADRQSELFTIPSNFWRFCLVYLVQSSAQNTGVSVIQEYLMMHYSTYRTSWLCALDESLWATKTAYCREHCYRIGFGHWLHPDGPILQDCSQCMYYLSVKPVEVEMIQLGNVLQLASLKTLIARLSWENPTLSRRRLVLAQITDGPWWNWDDVSAYADKLYECNPITTCPSANGLYYDTTVWDLASTFLSENGWKQSDAVADPSKKTNIFSHPPWNIKDLQ
ncbi:hypothetical protein EDD18DRAFT_1100846 [Armillaria luteobubalina]|uniref:Uncharacterized protein n=1 Tax=Armillaria luteobubalina TaxID=153913 RepID=A0AA39QGB4_9AGAR|nr:hypothetical protein EDD18DRAFT_1100846 [Armillaria luteobubalina]